jgi:hypothetical protein
VPRKKLLVDLSFAYSDYGVRLRGGSEVETVLRPRVALEAKRILPDFHRDLDGFDRIVLLDATYGLSARVNLAASVPLAIWHVHDVAHGDVAQRFGTQGLGDALVGVRLSLRPRLVGGLSLKLPTGAHDVGGEFGGGIQDPMLQPGTGALDFVGTLRYSWRFDRAGLDATFGASYEVTTTNPLDYRFGNQTVATATLSRSIARRVSVSLQAKLFHQDRSRYLGQGVPSTGGTFLYLTPGLRFTSAGQLSLYAYVLFPPYRHVNEAQLGPGTAVLTGISKLF